MASSQTRKNDLCKLFNLPLSDINEKISTLQSFITDKSESYLLNILSKSGLNTERAINLHFHADSVSPPNHHNNSNSNTSAPLSINKNINNIKLSPATNIIHKKRKRKRNTTPTDDDEYQPLNKRRRMQNNNTNNQSNHNTNSSMKEERDSDDGKDVESEHEQLFVHDTNWNNKVIGSFKIEYTLHQRCSVLSLSHIAQSKRRGDMSIESYGKKNKFMKPKKFKVYCERALNEFKLQKANIKVIMKAKKLISGKTEQEIKAEYDAIAMQQKRFQNKIRKKRAALVEIVTKQCTEALLKNHTAEQVEEIKKEAWFQRQVSDAAEKHLNISKLQKKQKTKRKTVNVDSKYVIEFEIALTRPNNDRTSFSKLNIPYTLALLSPSKSFIKEINQTLCVRNQWLNRSNLGYTLEGLLNFPCRFSYPITEDNNNASYDHKLNVTLLEYQLQSLDWMMKEEEDDIGFHRHLYALGAFPDHTPFYYSTIFEHLIVDHALPIAHGGFLCEEMGLGKTIISLALINCNKAHDLSRYSTYSSLKVGCVVNGLKYYKSRATLIIAPCSLVGQWEKECDDKSNSKLKYIRYYTSRSRDVRDYIDIDIVFTTYDIMSHETGHNRNLHTLHCIEWHRIILDESHYIKNGSCCRSQSINRLKAMNKWCLAGTPFGNRVVDIANQLLFIGLDQNSINRLQLSTISAGVDKFSSSDISNRIMFVMKKLVMRHKKDQTFNYKPIVNMVGKQENEIFVQFTAKQRKYYDMLYETAKQRYNYYKATGNVGRGYLDIFSSLNPARQSCSGHIYSKEELERKLSIARGQTLSVESMVRLNKHKSHKELYAMAKHDAFNVGTDGECPICFECPLDNPLQTPCRHLFCGECIRSILVDKPECPICREDVEMKDLKKPPKDEDLNEQKSQDKGNDSDDDDSDDWIRFDSKINVLMNELKKIKENKPNEKSLIFTSFSRSLQWICSELSKHNLEYRTLVGSMSVSKRKRQFEEFSNNSNVKVFVLTVRTGAVGITLTAANHVFMLEPTFNAALHRQAINRVYRLGQKKKVFIHTLIMKDSIEEKIWNINKHKKDKNDNNKNIAGNINADTNVKLQQHEISKLFE